MKEELQKICTDFIGYRDMAKRAFTWDSAYMPPICAGILLDNKQYQSVESLKGYRQMIKDRTGVFSNFRGTGIAPMACMLAVSDNPEKRMSEALKVYDCLKEHFWSSQYLPLVSMIVAQLAEEDRYKEIARKTKEMYDLMKKEHPFLTSGEDGPFAAMLVFAERSAQSMIAEVEKCYQLLKNTFFSSNAVQSLSHVLAFGEGSAESKCRRLVELYEKLKERGYKYGTTYELATLGALSILPCEMSEIVEDIIAVTDFLATQKGYGFFGTTKKQRMMHAAMLVSRVHKGCQRDVMTSAAVNSVIALVAAEQAAICAAIAASAASSSASS